MGENREAAEQGEQPVEECVLMRLLFVAGRGAAAFVIERFSWRANRVCQQCEKRKADGWENTEYCRRCEIQVFNLVCGECEDRRPSVKSGEGLCVPCQKFRDWPLGGWQASRVDETVWDAEPANRK